MGFDIYELMLDELKKKTDQRFDVICAFQVLEHISNPREFLEDIISLLRPSGKILLAVPNSAVMKKIDPQNDNLLNSIYFFHSCPTEKNVKKLYRIKNPADRGLELNIAR